MIHGCKKEDRRKKIVSESKVLFDEPPSKWLKEKYLQSTIQADERR